MSKIFPNAVSQKQHPSGNSDTNFINVNIWEVKTIFFCNVELKYSISFYTKCSCGTEKRMSDLNMGLLKMGLKN